MLKSNPQRHLAPPDEEASCEAGASELLRLRRELDLARLENQRLAIELGNAKLENAGPRALLHAALRSAFFKGRSAFRLLREERPALKRLTGLHGGAVPAASNAHAAPYRAGMLKPVQQDRPRILHVIGNFNTGGSAQLVVDLFEHLGYCFEQEVLTKNLPSRPRYVGIPLYDEPRLDGAVVRAHLLRFQPHLLHIHFLGHLQDEWGEADWQWYHEAFQVAEQEGVAVIQNVNIPVTPYASPAVNVNVYVSDYVKDTFGSIDSRGLTIYPGSDLELFSREPHAHIPDDCIGMVYRLQPDKLNESSIDPFIEVVQRRTRTRVIIVGGGHYLGAYRRKVNYGRVRGAFMFADYVAYQDLPGYLAQMSVFVAPVHTESFGQVSPFAMGMGLPIAGYNVGALAEILGSDACLAPPADSRRLADIIVDLLEDREKRLAIGEQNRRRARELFSVQTMVSAYHDLYQNVLAGRRAGAHVTSSGHLDSEFGWKSA